MFQASVRFVCISSILLDMPSFVRWWAWLYYLLWEHMTAVRASIRLAHSSPLPSSMFLLCVVTHTTKWRGVKKNVFLSLSFGSLFSSMCATNKHYMTCLRFATLPPLSPVSVFPKHGWEEHAFWRLDVWKTDFFTACVLLKKTGGRHLVLPHTVHMYFLFIPVILLLLLPT